VHSLALICIGVSRFSRSGDMIVGVDIENESRDPDQTPLKDDMQRFSTKLIKSSF